MSLQRTPLPSPWDNDPLLDPINCWSKGLYRRYWWRRNLGCPLDSSIINFRSQENLEFSQVIWRRCLSYPRKWISNLQHFLPECFLMFFVTRVSIHPRKMEIANRVDPGIPRWGIQRRRRKKRATWGCGGNEECNMFFMYIYIYIHDETYYYIHNVYIYIYS